jgi:hypothetical protein
MSDMGDLWRDLKPAMQEEKQRKRASNREASTRI